MAKSSDLEDLELPRRVYHGDRNYIAGPTYHEFKEKFGDVFPKPYFLDSDLGPTAVYDLPPPSGRPKNQILMIHGANTPALGMLPLTRQLQTLDVDAHVVLFDLWGHGLSATPLVAHTPQIFHSQALQVLAYMQWTKAHIIGFSFGGITAVTFTMHNPQIPLSVVLIAPAGLMDKKDRGPKMCELLDARGRDPEAIECLFEWLEGTLVLPADWYEKMRSGQVVAEALKQFSIDKHEGHQRSVLGMARDGGIFDREEDYISFVKVPVPKLVVLGSSDGICDRAQLGELGIGRVEVIEKADHGLVRDRADEVGGIVHRFWSELEVKKT